MISFPDSKLNSTIIAIGASAGGTEAILEILKQLPTKSPAIVITQHMPEIFTDLYAKRLNKICAIEVSEAKDQDELRPGLALIAPGNMQMEVHYVNHKYIVRCFSSIKTTYYNPSIDVLFHSVAKNVKENAIGIILTGMGNDGANGLLEMRNNGSFTIGQDKDSSAVYGMPMVAEQLNAVCVQASPDQIPSVLMKYFQKNYG